MLTCMCMCTYAFVCVCLRRQVHSMCACVKWSGGGCQGENDEYGSVPLLVMDWNAKTKAGSPSGSCRELLSPSGQVFLFCSVWCSLLCLHALLLLSPRSSYHSKTLKPKCHKVQCHWWLLDGSKYVCLWGEPINQRFISLLSVIYSFSQVIMVSITSFTSSSNCAE